MIHDSDSEGDDGNEEGGMYMKDRRPLFIRGRGPRFIPLFHRMVLNMVAERS